MNYSIADQQHAIAILRSKIGAIIGLRLAVFLLSGWLLAWGVAVLVLRGVWLVPRTPLLWGLAGIGAVAIVGIVVALRRRPPVDAVRAVLDSRGRCGGLLMTSGAMEIGDWQSRFSRPQMPKVHWRGKRSWGVLGASTVFLSASFLMPSRFMAPTESQRLEVGVEVAKLAEKINLLEEEKILPPEKAKNLEDALKQVQQESAGNDPAKTWEALDHIEQAIAKSGAEGGEKTGRHAQQAASAQELAEALQQAQDKLAGQTLAEAMKALADQIQNATAENKALDKQLAEKLDELKDAAEKGELSGEQLKELAEALKECKAGDLKQLGKLADARLIDADSLKECEGDCQIDPEALAELLIECNGKEGKDGKDAAEALGKWAAKAGKGGITRGPGAADISWTDPSNKEDITFKEHVLPPSSIASVKESRMQGVSAGAPTADMKPTAVAGGALDVSAKGQGSAHTQVILPEHKGVVRRYFERGREGAKDPSNRGETK